jgi:hypothetical protein
MELNFGLANKIVCRILRIGGQNYERMIFEFLSVFGKEHGTLQYDVWQSATHAPIFQEKLLLPSSVCMSEAYPGDWGKSCLPHSVKFIALYTASHSRIVCSYS